MAVFSIRYLIVLIFLKPNFQLRAVFIRFKSTDVEYCKYIEKKTYIHYQTMISLTRYDDVIQSESTQHTQILLYPHIYYIDAYCDLRKKNITILNHLVFYFFFRLELKLINYFKKIK
jgi:hypothetical protein